MAVLNFLEKLLTQNKQKDGYHLTLKRKKCLSILFTTSFIFIFYFCSVMKYADLPDNDADVLEITETAVQTEAPFHLIVWNDDVNTFEWVIETLMEVCKHTFEQAEQCAIYIHFKGKYAVKQGTYEELEPMCTAITDRGISATVEVAR
jgi:ATP-dependent Clp protease adaptor protein ClpS